MLLSRKRADSEDFDVEAVPIVQVNSIMTTQFPHHCSAVLEMKICGTYLSNTMTIYHLMFDKSAEETPEAWWWERPFLSCLARNGEAPIPSSDGPLMGLMKLGLDF